MLAGDRYRSYLRAMSDAGLGYIINVVRVYDAMLIQRMTLNRVLHAYRDMQDSRTPLMVAALYDNSEAVEALIASGDEIEAKDDVSGTM